MTTGLGDKTAAIKQPRHRTQQAVLDGRRQANVGAPDVAQRGEAAIEAGSKKPRRKMRQVRHGRLHHPGDVQPGPINVHVSIDQPWHQDTVTAVDDLVITRRQSFGNLADTTTFHEHICVRPQRFRFAVEDAGRSKYNSSLHFQLPPAH